MAVLPVRLLDTSENSVLFLRHTLRLDMNCIQHAQVETVGATYTKLPIHLGFGKRVSTLNY